MLVAIWVSMSMMLGACSEMIPLVSLPSMTKLPETVLNKDEPQKPMNDMMEKGQTPQAEAAKQIGQEK